MSIPATAIVASNPSVLSPGGLGLALNDVMLTDSARVPIGTVQQFANAVDVGTFFGTSSDEFGLAETYFAGYTGSSIKPALLYFTQYNASAVAEYLRGGMVTVLTLVQLQALTGSLTVVMDGYTHTAASINLSSATSYSSAASLINTGINGTQPTQAVVTGSISGTTMTVSAVNSGTLSVGQTVTGAGVTSGTLISALGTGTGGTGTYTVSESQTVASETLTMKATAIVVAFDSVSGAFTFTSGITGVPSTAAFATGTLAASIFLTQVTGAVVSQGAAAASPAAFMTALTQITQNWATFMTTFNPDNSGNTVKQEFCAWVALQNNRWNYACWDEDASPTVTVPATSSLGYILQQNGTSGVTLIYRSAVNADGDFGDGANMAAFYCGTVASINFQQLNGRITTKFKGLSGLLPDILDQTTGQNLAANGYNYYGDWASATEQFRFFANGVVSGEFLWADGYVNQIWMNTSFQTQLMILLTSVGSVPFDQPGADLIRGAMLTVIQQALRFGAFSPGVQLSPLQIAEVNNAAGVDISTTLFAQGWYLQILPVSAQTRAARGPWNITFWYTDAGAVQSINVNSVALL